MKGATIEKRKIERDDQWTELFNLCNLDEKVYIDEFYHKAVKLMRLPLPPLSFTVYENMLKDLKIELVKCSGEADQEIANACSLNNKDGVEKFFCVGNDR